MQRVLFLCVHNSARSQMAGGMLRTWAGDRFEVHSAGSEVAEVRPLAIRAMAEIGIDISGQRTKNVAEYSGQSFDWAITVCDEAKEACPYFPGARSQSHWSFDDPSAARGSCSPADTTHDTSRAAQEAARLGRHTDEEYRAERDAALAKLPDGDRVVVFDAHRARILALPDAINVASPARREELCRIVLERVVVADRQVAEIDWTPQAQPFLKRQRLCPQGGSSTRPLSSVTDDEYDPLAWYVA